MIRPAFVACALLALAACAEEPAPEAEATAAPMGEVLERSISDEMIPYDLLRSQAPLAAPLPGEEGAGAAGEVTQEEAAVPVSEPAAAAPGE